MIFTEDGAIYKLEKRDENRLRRITVTCVSPNHAEPRTQIMADVEVGKIIVGNELSYSFKGMSQLVQKAKVVKLVIEQEAVLPELDPPTERLPLPVAPQKSIKERFSDVCRTHGFQAIDSVGQNENCDILVVTENEQVYKLTSFRHQVALKDAFGAAWLWGEQGKQVYRFFVETGCFNESENTVDATKRNVVIQKIIDLVGREKALADRASFLGKVTRSFDLVLKRNELRTCYYHEAGATSSCFSVSPLEADAKINNPLKMFGQALGTIKFLATRPAQENGDFEAILAGFNS